MLKMSFYNGTMKKKELEKFITETKKPIRYTYGFKYRKPTTMNKPITKEQALNILEKESYLDAEELEDCLDLNAYSSNDMW